MILEQTFKFQTAPAPSGNLYRVRTDRELGRTDRAVAGNPMIFYFRDSKCPVSKEWQFALAAWNLGMTLHNVAMLLDDAKFACNGTGLYGNEPRRNWIEGEDLDAAQDPKWSKFYTCGDAVVEMIGGVITCFDGSMPPPLKAGMTQPATVQAARANPNIYAMTPQTHPHMFYAAVNAANDGAPSPFPHGANYSWYRGGGTPVVFLPHVTDLRDGLVVYQQPVAGTNMAELVRI